MLYNFMRKCIDVYYKNLAKKVFYNKASYNKSDKVLKGYLIELIQNDLNLFQNENVNVLLKLHNDNMIDLSKDINYENIFNFVIYKMMDIFDENVYGMTQKEKDNILKALILGRCTLPEGSSIKDYALALFFIFDYLKKENYTVQLKEELCIIFDNLLNAYYEEFMDLIITKDEDKHYKNSIEKTIDSMNELRK